MGFDPAIRRKGRKLALEKKEQLNPSDIFLSEEFKNYLNSLSRTMGNGAGETTRIIVEDTGPDGDSFTNGSCMHLNCGAEKLDYFDTLEGKFLGLMGTFFHEKAHDLFNDFNEGRRANSFIKDGLFYGEAPKGMNAAEEADWTDMEEALKEKKTRPIFLEVFHSLDNIVADRHDEECLIDAYGSFAGESLLLSRQAKQSFAEFFETSAHAVNTGDLPELSFMYNNMLQMCLFDDILARNQAAVEQSGYWKTLEKIRTHARIACATDDVIRKYSELNWIMLYFWPYIRNAIQQNRQEQNNNQSGQSEDGKTGDSNSQGNPQQKGTASASQDEVQKVLEQLKNGAKNSGATTAPSGQHSSDIAIANRANARSGKVPEKNRTKAEAAGKAMSEQGKQALYHVLESIRNDIAQNRAEAELESEAGNNIVDAVAAVNQSESHRGIPVRTERILSVTSEDIERYKAIMNSELNSVSRRLQKQMLDALRDLKEGCVRRHRQFGRTIIPNDAYRPDQRYFASRKLPQDLPDMAVSVLVDHSGSMNGTRIETAMKASLLLHSFCTGLNIPVAVAGHNAVNGGGGVNYMIYADFEQISGKDRYRASKMAASITRMKANHCNRDGLALKIAEELLSRRPEQVKLLMIVSDGRPNHDGYGGEEAAKDIQGILRKAKQKGIEVIACAIGDDKDNIKAIYGDSFVDISDLGRLPKTLVNIVKKRIISSAI